MRVEFRKKKCINVRDKGKVEVKQYDFPVGIHTMPKELETHWYFKALVESGDVVILDSSRHSGGQEVKPKLRNAKKSIIYQSSQTAATAQPTAST